MTPPAGLLPPKIPYASDPAESNPKPLEDTQIGEMEAAVNEELCETHIENSETSPLTALDRASSAVTLIKKKKGWHPGLVCKINVIDLVPVTHSTFYWWTQHELSSHQMMEAGVPHGESSIASLLAFFPYAVHVKGCQLKLAIHAQDSSDLKGHIAASQLCCPACWAFLSFLDPETHFGVCRFHLKAHPVVDDRQRGRAPVEQSQADQTSLGKLYAEHWQYHCPQYIGT
ncbi:hypothetical protein L208DRAFT_1383068 [Tricholoma matsutake]|nr:hypothetical protein L208DRAFT_1383068 [Tricholoma matsutake 945]